MKLFDILVWPSSPGVDAGCKGGGESCESYHHKAQNRPKRKNITYTWWQILYWLTLLIFFNIQKSNTLNMFLCNSRGASKSANAHHPFPSTHKRTLCKRCTAKSMLQLGLENSRQYSDVSACFLYRPCPYICRFDIFETGLYIIIGKHVLLTRHSIYTSF